MKYIILKSTLAGEEQKIPIIFPDFMVHILVAKYMVGMLIKQHDRNPHITVASAGSITISNIECFGKSETCKVESDPNDADLIQMFDYFQGLVPEPSVEQTLRDLLKAKP